jgi:hypothetical protein
MGFGAAARNKVPLSRRRRAKRMQGKGTMGVFGVPLWRLPAGEQPMGHATVQRRKPGGAARRTAMVARAETQPLREPKGDFKERE